MKKIFIAFFLLLNSSLFSQVKITGKVIDAISNEPLTGVVVVVEKNGTITGITGDFTLNITDYNFPLVAEFKMVGYNTEKVTFFNQQAVTVKLTSSNKMLNQVVVAGQRSLVNVYRTTAATEVIKPYLIENKITTNMNKLVDQIPSVHVVDGQINIRSGSGWSYGAGSRVLVLLDGMPFLTGDAGQVQWKFLPIENVEQVEVIKGASSVLFGSSALNGMVNLTTKQATDKPYTKVNVFAGVYSKPNAGDGLNYPYANLQNQAGFNIFHAQKFGSDKNNSFSVAANYLNDEGYRFGEYDKRFRLNYNFRFKPKPKLNYGIAGGLLLTDGASFLLWNGIKERYTALNRQQTITKSTNVYVDPTLTYYTGAFKHDIKTRFLHINNDVDNLTQNQDNSSDLRYADYQVSRNLTYLKLMLIGGATMVYTTSNSPLYNGINTSANRAIFVNAEKYLLNNNKLILNAGLRYEYFAMNDVGEAKPVSRFGLNYMATKYTFLRASYGQGYRFPSIAERYITTSVGALNIFSNPFLQSETGSNSEIGIKQAFLINDFKGFFDVAYFDMRFDNMIEFNFGMWGGTDFFNLNNFGFKSVNIGKSKINGLDFSMGAEGKIGEVLVQTLMGYTFTNPIIIDENAIFATDSFGTKYNFRNTRSDSVNVLKYRFRHLAKADIQFTYKKFISGFSMRYNSFIQNIDAAFIYLNPSIPDIALGRNYNTNGVWFFDLRFGYNFTSKINCNIAISNLLNTEAMMRPADMVAPRLTIVNLGYSF
ncbi:MAG: TonB-dependent receptor domain-containing protein [Bacteroidia bacterium]